MVALADQMLPDFGTALGPLQASHSDLTHHFPATRTTKKLRRALIRSIVMVVGRPTTGPTTASAN